MRLTGVVLEDELDPRIAQAQSLKMMPVLVLGGAWLMNQAYF